MQPFNIQFMQERERDHEMGAEVEMEDKVSMALRRAKRACKQGYSQKCDDMMEEYEKMKVMASEQEDMPLLERLFKLVRMWAVLGLALNI